MLTRVKNSSSLQRLESSHVRLERKMSQIGEYVQKIGQGSPGNPSVSAIAHQGFGTPLLNKKLMENAEIGQRRWASIGVDEWIQAGRWWLLKVYTPLHGLLEIHVRFND